MIGNPTRRHFLNILKRYRSRGLSERGALVAAVSEAGVECIPLDEARTDAAFQKGVETILVAASVAMPEKLMPLVESVGRMMSAFDVPVSILCGLARKGWKMALRGPEREAIQRELCPPVPAERIKSAVRAALRRLGLPYDPEDVEDGMATLQLRGTPSIFIKRHDGTYDVGSKEVLAVLRAERDGVRFLPTAIMVSDLARQIQEENDTHEDLDRRRIRLEAILAVEEDRGAAVGHLLDSLRRDSALDKHGKALLERIRYRMKA